MFCPRCNTELPDSAALCSNCGSPVSVASPLQTQAATFSYLPAGTPQWPATASANAPYNTTGYAQKTVEPAYAPPQHEPEGPRRKSNSLSFPTVLLLLFVSILVGGGLTFGVLTLQNRGNSPRPAHAITLTPATAQTPSATTTPGAQGTTLPTPSSFHPISSTDIGVSTQYPSDWTADAPQKSTTSTILSVHPTQPDGIAISFERFTQSTSATIKSTSDVNQNNFAQFQAIQSVSNFKVTTSAAAQQTIGGAQWDEQDATFSSNNIVYHLTTIAAQYKQMYYDIVYFAPDSVYGQAVQKYFQPMLTSFKFLT